MRVLSLQIGRPRWIEKSGSRAFSSIARSPVRGPVATQGEAFEGDEQGDKTCHGGRYQAIYSFASEQYPFWEAMLGRALAPGSFGENLTTAGLDESKVEVGDCFRIGTVELMARAPRIPCATLAFFLDSRDTVGQFLENERPGIYYSIEAQGEMQAGDEIVSLGRSGAGITIVDLMRMHSGRERDPALFRRAITLDLLPPDLKDRFERKLFGGH